MKPVASGTLLILAALTASCSGGTPRTAFVPLTQPAVRSVEPDLSTGGIINTKTFAVASGQNIRVTKNLAVFATSSVSIAGTLQVPAGISVAFFTPMFTIEGPSGLIFAATSKHYLGHVDDFVSACQINVANSSQWQVPGGDNLALTATSKSSRKHPCSVTIGSNKNLKTKQTLILEPGAKGGTYPHRYDGANGGWIEIGSPEAIAFTEALAKKDGHSGMKAYAPSLVTLNSQLAAGNGGNGRDDIEGTQGGTMWTFSPGNGGIGGSVEIAGGKIAGSVPHVFAGSGGNGGTAGSTFYAYGQPYPLDGTASEPNGISADIAMGSGGGGGGIFVTSKAPRNVWEQAGSGGNPSAVALPGPGGGCCSTVPKTPTIGTGNGGSLSLELAAPGFRGPHGNNKPKKPKNGKYSSMKFTGGSGSAWINTNYVTGAAAAQGGHGGDLTIVPPPHLAIASLKDYGLKIQVLNFGNGAGSITFCAPNPPSAPGLNGGNAGSLHDNGLDQYLTTVNSSSAYGDWGFNGGYGGDGTPPGNGGKAGTNDEGKQLGRTGQNGVVC